MEFKADGDMSLKEYWGKHCTFIAKIAIGQSRRETNTVLKPVRHCGNMMIISKGCRPSRYVDLRDYSGKYFARCR